MNTPYFRGLRTHWTYCQYCRYCQTLPEVENQRWRLIKPEVVASMLLIKILETLQRLGIFLGYINSNGSSNNATRQCQTPKIQNPIWRPETGSSYISASNQDFLKISKARYMFSHMAVPVDMCTTASDNVPHQKLQYGGQKLVISVFFAAILDLYGVGLCCVVSLTCSLE